MALSNFEIRFFRDQGYLLLPGFLPTGKIPPLVAIADEHLEKARRQAEEGKDLTEKTADGMGTTIFRLSKLTERSPLFAEVALEPRIGEIMRQLLGDDAALCLNRHNMMVVKSPGGTRPIDFHQDGRIWAHDNIISVMTFLDEATLENGCLHVVPGGHRFGLLDVPEREDGRRHMDLDQADQAALVRQALPVPMNPGDTLIFNSVLPHGSKVNRSTKLRRNMTFAYMSQHEVSRTGHTRAEPVRLLPLNQAMTAA